MTLLDLRSRHGVEGEPISLCVDEQGHASVLLGDLLLRLDDAATGVEDHAGGAVLLGDDDTGAVVLGLGADGSVAWAQRYRSGDEGTLANDLDSRTDGVLALDGAASWLWRLAPDGAPRWGRELEGSDVARFVAFTGDEIAAAARGSSVVGGAKLLRLADADGALIELATDNPSNWLGLVDDTLGGLWLAFEFGGIEFSHLNPDWQSGSAAVDLGVSELFAIDHDEDGELVVAVREQEMDLLRVVLFRLNGDAGGVQNLTYDYGDPRAMSLGPADDLILGFEEHCRRLRHGRDPTVGRDLRLRRGSPRRHGRTRRRRSHLGRRAAWRTGLRGPDRG